MKILKIETCWRCFDFDEMHSGTVPYCKAEKRHFSFDDNPNHIPSWCPLDDAPCAEGFCAKRNLNREQIMQRWDAWRKYIADGGKGSWPRDEFESILDDLEGLNKQPKNKPCNCHPHDVVYYGCRCGPGTISL